MAACIAFWDFKLRICINNISYPLEYPFLKLWYYYPPQEEEERGKSAPKSLNTWQVFHNKRLFFYIHIKSFLNVGWFYDEAYLKQYSSIPIPPVCVGVYCGKNKTKKNCDSFRQKKVFRMCKCASDQNSSSCRDFRAENRWEQREDRFTLNTKYIRKNL